MTSYLPAMGIPICRERGREQSKLSARHPAELRTLSDFFGMPRSEGPRDPLGQFVHEPAQHSMHPLLLEPAYWQARLQAQEATRPFLLITPRPDLSNAGCEVQEIRFRAFDGHSLWGLMGRCPILAGSHPAVISLSKSSQPLRIDKDLVHSGAVQVLVQLPAGRRLEDRVLDALRAAEVAAAMQSVDGAKVQFALEINGLIPDEVRIAQGLRLGGFVR
jgi:hypothetical protein